MSVAVHGNGNNASASNYRTLFIIGCPRSGTTWVQLLLSQQREIATAPETQIFAYYIDQMRRQWRHEHEGVAAKEQGGAGLSRLLTETEFEELCRNAASLVLDRIAARNPGAHVVVEKSPKHALSADFIGKLFPDAHFLHVIRDPRDTATSLMQAARGWGRGWAPRNAIEAARMWRMHVESARRISGERVRYREIKYEEMRSAPAARLYDVLGWLGLDRDLEACEVAVRACDFERLQGSTNTDLPVPSGQSPAGFFRKGQIGSWRDDLSTTEVRIVEHICGELMDELGYDRKTSMRSLPVRVRVHDALARVRASIDWQLARLLNVV